MDPGPEFHDAPGWATKTFKHISAKAQDNLTQGRPSPLLAQPIHSEAHERDLTETAIKYLKGQGVDFGDLRLGWDRYRFLQVQDDNIASHVRQDSTGIGIRALVKGFWGFAATPDLSPSGIKQCVDQAVAMAKAVAASTPAELGTTPDKWAGEPAHIAEFHTPVGICPFSATEEELAAPLREAAQNGLEQPGIKRVMAMIPAFGRRRIFASTDGAFILSTHCIVDSLQRFIAVKGHSSAYRTVVGTALAGGLEHVIEMDFPSLAADACKEALAKCDAAKPDPGKYTLILDGHNLSLTMHESVGHPTELDRVLGYELGFAGGSFATLDKLRRFRYASPIVNFTADNTLRYGGASQGYDDEGVLCQRFPVIREGILVGYGTNRETAHAIGLERSNGTCRATNWYDAPIVRIPNLYLEPGRDQLSLQALIEDTKDGILMMGRDSFSIDQMRYNFQFGADMCYRIRNGRVEEPLRDVIYQSISPEFWNSCDAICDSSEWQMHGVFNCGKGQPIQASKMMHGAAPARFSNIQVGY